MTVLFQGDIANVLPTDLKQMMGAEEDGRGSRNAIKSSWRRWPNAIIPYVISSEFSQVHQDWLLMLYPHPLRTHHHFCIFVQHERSVIAKAMQHYHTKTCIRCPTTRLQLYNTTTLPLYHTIPLPLYHITTLPHHHTTTIPLYNTTSVPLYHPTTLPPYHSTTSPHYHTTNLPHYHNTCIRFRPRTSEKAYIHVMKVLVTKHSPVPLLCPVLHHGNWPSNISH